MAIPERGEIRRVFDRIQNVIEDFHEPSDAELDQLYTEYCNSVDQVNVELAECDALLDRNQPNDAIQRADRTDLLELVASLGLPDRDGWEDYLEEKDKHPPPRLSVEAAGRLQKCYGPAKAREPLLRQFRRQSLAQSPLRSRLNLLWQLHENDAQPETWEKDIIEFQKARLNEVSKEADEANNSGDLRWLNRLYKELRNPNWFGERDKKLIRRTGENILQRRAESARKQLPKILEEMRDAEAGGRDNIKRGRELRKQLDKALEFANLTEESDLYERAREAVEWIEEIEAEDAQQATYKSLKNELQHTLDRVADTKRHSERSQLREFLRQLEQKLGAFDEGVPPEMQKRLNSTYEDQDIEDSRRFALRIALTVTAVCAAGVLMFFGLQWRNAQQELAKHERELAAMVKRQDFSATEKYMQRLKIEKPHIFEQPSIQSEYATHFKNQAAEEQRAERVANGIEQARKSLDSVATIAGVKEHLSKLDGLLDDRSPDNERALVDEVRQLFEHRGNEIQEKIDNDFDAAVEKLANLSKAVDSTDIPSLTTIRDAFDTLSKKREVNEKRRESAEGLRVRIDNRITAEGNRLVKLGMIEEITKSIGTLSSYEASLKRYCKKYSDEPCSKDFKQVVEQDAPLWNAVDEQNAFVKKWSAKNLSEVNSATALKLAEEGQEFLDNHPKFAERELLEEVIAYLQGISVRVSGTGVPLHDDLVNRIFTNQTIEGMYMVLTKDGETKDGERYYMTKPPRQLPSDRNKYDFHAYLDSGLQDPERFVFSVGKLDVLTRDGKYEWRAPQWTFATRAKRMLLRMRNENWEKTMLKILEILYGETRMDPILKLQLMQNIVTIAMKGSPLLEKAFQQAEKEMAAIGLPNNPNFLDPKDVEANRFRRDIVKFFKEMDDPVRLIRDVVAQKQRFEKVNLGGQYERVGWLYEGEEGWVCAGPPPSARDKRELYVGGKMGDSFEFRKIGKAVNRQYHVTASSSDFVQGRLLYLYAAPKTDRDD
jgi:hypothetical protein